MNSLQSAHPKIQRMCEEESDDQEAVAKLFEINDSIHRTIERYRLIKKGDVEAAQKIPQGTLGTSTGVAKNANNELSLIDFGADPEPEAAAANDPPTQTQSVESDLLGLSLGDQSQPYGQGGGIALGFGANTSMFRGAKVHDDRLTVMQTFLARRCFPLSHNKAQPNQRPLLSHRERGHRYCLRAPRSQTMMLSLPFRDRLPPQPLPHPFRNSSNSNRTSRNRIRLAILQRSSQRLVSQDLERRTQLKMGPPSRGLPLRSLEQALLLRPRTTGTLALHCQKTVYQAHLRSPFPKKKSGSSLTLREISSMRRLSRSLRGSPTRPPVWLPSTPFRLR